MSDGQKIMRAAGFLMGANLLSRLLGFVRESLMAGLFGQTAATDAYNTAFILPDLVYWLLVGGILSAAFIPVLSGFIAAGREEEGWIVVSSVVNMVFILLCLLVIAAIFAVPAFVAWQAPGFTPENQALTVVLCRILLLQPVVLAFSGITMGVLNSYKIFWPSAAGTVLYNVCVIGCGALGADPERPESISGFAFGVVLGALVNFLVQIPFLRRVGLRYHPLIAWRHPGVRRILALALPMIVMYALNQLQVVVNTNLASALPPGSVSAIWYSYRLFQLPVGIFALAIGVAVLPTLSEQAAQRRRREFVHTLSEAIRAIAFLTIPISVFFIVLRTPLIRLLFEHGAFGPDDTATTAIPLLFFALGISAQAVLQILPRGFYALQNTWIPVLLGTVAMALTVALMFLLIGPLRHGGLALATSIGVVVQDILLFFVLRRKTGGLDGWRILGALARTTLISLVMGAAVWQWSSLAGVWWGAGKLAACAILGTSGLIGLFVFIVFAELLRMPELRSAWQLFGRR
ncbi:MAG: murein biosynthesis integral membrane protein MurJ [Gracilibacteraceae bacterium]|jgi:putative peptidoglycan lipid II flippase|nr:murein biosynthesis integral membrane protein MurJ [Gracilibacteraceae bacterium]